MRDVSQINIIKEAREISLDYNLPIITTEALCLAIIQNQRVAAALSTFSGFDQDETFEDIIDILINDTRSPKEEVSTPADKLKRSDNMEHLFRNVSISFELDKKKIFDGKYTAHETNPELWVLATMLHLFPKSMTSMLLERQGVTIDRLTKYIAGEDQQRLVSILQKDHFKDTIKDALTTYLSVTTGGSKMNLEKENKLYATAKDISDDHNAAIAPESIALALLESKEIGEFISYTSTTFNKERMEKKLLSLLDKVSAEDKTADKNLETLFKNVKVAKNSDLTDSFKRDHDVTYLGVFLYTFPNHKLTKAFAAEGITLERVSEFVEDDISAVLTGNQGENFQKNFDAKHITASYSYPATVDEEGFGGNYDSSKEPETPILDEFFEDLVLTAKSGAYTPTIGRKDEIRDTLRILRQKKKSNPMLLGGAGVGKTAIVEGLAQMASSDELPDDFKDIRLLSTDLETFMAGTKFRGELEARIRTVIDEASNSSKRIVMFMDEAHTMTGLLESFKPALARGDISIIGATTDQEFKKNIAPNNALARRFDIVRVGEPSRDETFEILKGIKETYEAHHKCAYSDEALELILNKGDQCLLDKFSADKEITIMDKAATILKEYDDVDLTFDTSGYPIVTGDMVLSALSSMTGVSLDRLTTTEREATLNLEKELQENVIGQNDAVKTLSDAVIRAKSGLGEEEKPEAAILFAGPTGVGKTEATKVLAKQLGRELVRFDMSEFSEEHSVSKLFGSPPGYVGSDNGGRATEAVKKNPDAIFLFDEVEKAHPTVLNTLLQLLDDGRLTDGAGETANFRGAMVILTSNAGAAHASQQADEITEKQPIGFVQTTKEDREKEAEKASAKTIEENINKIFSPEFRNRLDAVVQFNALDLDNVKEISPIIAKQLSKRSEKSHKWSIEFNKQATDWLAVKGFDPKMGARPLKRAFVEHVETPLSRHIMENDIGGTSGVINVSVNDDEESLAFSFAKTVSNDNKETLLLDSPSKAPTPQENKL